MLIILIILGLISLILLMWQLSNLLSVFFGSPYVMADKKVIRQALKLVKIRKGEIFYDLGCGNGQVVIEAAKLGARAVGFEISPYYFILGKIKIFLWKIYNIYRWSDKSSIEMRFKNIKNVDLSKAGVVYCYLLPKMLEKLAPKFKRELKPGSCMISIGFPIIHARACKMERIQTRGHKIFVYYF